MKDKLSITVIIAAKNESENIGRCLKALGKAERVVVVDSGSSDGMVGIVEATGAELVQFEYSGGYPKKRQWALENLEIRTDWTLLLDADEFVPEGLWREIEAVVEGNGPCDGYYITKGYHFLGRKFRYGGFSFQAMLLFRTGAGKFENLIDAPETGLDMEVHERVIIDGNTSRLKTPLVHEDFKGLHAYIDRHNRYATWESQLRWFEKHHGQYGQGESIGAKLSGDAQSRRRYLKRIAMAVPCEPLLWFAYHYLLRGAFLEGKEGFIASAIRSGYIALVHAKMYELEKAEDPQGRGRE